MRIAVFVLAGLLAGLVAPTTHAHADGFYFTESLGGTDVKGELGDYMDSALRLRLAVGMRSGSWAIEAHIGADIGTADHPRSINDGPAVYDFDSLTTYGVDVKYLQPVAEHVEVYLRGGASYAQFDPGGSLAGFAGRGLGGGAGIQLKGKVRALGFLAWPFFFLKIGPKVTAAVFLDASYDFYRLHADGRLDATPAIDAQLTSITGGFAIGSDF